MQYGVLKATIEKDLINQNKTYTKQNLSFNYIKSLFNQYSGKNDEIELCQFWYEDKNNPLKTTWIEVEAINYGWLCSIYKEKDLKEKLYKKLTSWIPKNIKSIIYNRQVYNIKTDDYISILIPMRDLTEYDITITFSHKGICLL